MTSYKDCVRIIEIIKAEIEMLQLDLDYWLGKNSNHPLWSEGARKFGLDEAAKRTDFLYSRMERLEQRLKAYEEIEKEIRENIEQLEGLEYQIARMRYMDGKTYKDIAEELGYSHDHIRRVASRSKRDTVSN